MEAKLNARDVSISTKQSVEICNLIRGKKIGKAKQILDRVIEKKQAVPYKRYKKEIPHRKGKIATGRFPLKASKEILNLLETAESNAQNIGLSSDLIISHISAHKASMQFHFGRKRRRKMKRTHLNIIVKESQEKPKKKVEVKEEKKEIKKVETEKKETKKEEPKKLESKEKEKNKK